MIRMIAWLPIGYPRFSVGGRLEACNGRCSISRTSARGLLCTFRVLFLIVLIACSGGRTSLAQSTISLFANAVPANAVEADYSAVTLGVKFYSTQPGTISGIRFYRGAKDSYGYVARLYSAGGTLLAQAKMATDSCAVPCWEQANFASPISIAANTTYIASYYTSNGRYPDGYYGLTNGASNGPLIAPASSASGGNGVYYYGQGFPKQTWEDSNYFVDVVFTPAPQTRYLVLNFSPEQPSIPSTAPSGTIVATITASWSDGSPFTGTLSFGAPYSNDHATFALSGNNLIVNPSGPGLSADGNTVQNATIVATQ